MQYTLELIPLVELLNAPVFVEGRPRKTSGHRKSMPTWNVLIRDNREGYSSWE
jgi:hypothetical protein